MAERIGTLQRKKKKRTNLNAKEKPKIWEHKEAKGRGTRKSVCGDRGEPNKGFNVGGEEYKGRGPAGEGRGARGKRGLMEGVGGSNKKSGVR